MPIYKIEEGKGRKAKYKVRINYTDARGEYRTLTRNVYGMDEARLLEAQLLKEYASGAVADAPDTFTKLVDAYLKVYRMEVREATYDKLVRILNRDILPFFKDYKLTRLSPAVITKWKTSFEGRGLKVNTLNNKYAALHAVFEWALKMEYIPRNPMSSVSRFKNTGAVVEDRIRFYTPEQFQLFMGTLKAKAVSTDDYRYYVFFAIAYYTGMRKGEINALKWSDIEQDIIYVRRSVSQKVKSKTIVETAPKNNSSIRQLQMPLPLIEILAEHKTRQQRDKVWSKDYRVCGGRICLADTSVNNVNTWCADAAGLPRIRVHDFRHSHASLLCAMGINIQEVARRLGHSDVKMTWNTYSHLYPQEGERAVSVLNSIRI